MSFFHESFAVWDLTWATIVRKSWECSKYPTWQRRLDLDIFAMSDTFYSSLFALFSIKIVNEKHGDGHLHTCMKNKTETCYIWSLDFFVFVFAQIHSNFQMKSKCFNPRNLDMLWQNSGCARIPGRFWWEDRSIEQTPTSGVKKKVCTRRPCQIRLCAMPLPCFFWGLRAITQLGFGSSHQSKGLWGVKEIFWPEKL